MKTLFTCWAVGALAAAFFAFLPASNAHAASLVTDGSSEIGSFPIAESDMPNTSWRIDTSSVGSATVTSTPFDFAGPSNTTLSNPTGWTRVINDSEDDDYVRIPAGFNLGFNGTNYTSVYLGSNTYYTFGAGDSEYSGLGADVPPLPGVHVCSSDNSYQRVYYRFDDANTLRVRYEGTDSTSGTIGQPTIVYEAVYYAGESYHDLYIGRNDSCSGDYGPDAAKLGAGNDGDYSLPATLPGSPEHDRGDFYADTLSFSEDLDPSAMTMVEDAITAGASYPPRAYEWTSSSTVAIYATTSVTFYDDVLTPLTASDYDFAAYVLLIDADDVAPTASYLGDGSYDYELSSTCPSAACDLGNVFGNEITFSEDLDLANRAGVEAAITAGASHPLSEFVWGSASLWIYATTSVVFADDVRVDLYDALGNTATNQRIIDSLPTPPMTVWVDDDYTEFSSGGHVWEEDAFDNISDALDAVAAGGRVNVLAGDYNNDSGTINKNGVTITGPLSGSPARVANDCSDIITVDGASGATISNLTLLQTNGGGVDGTYCYNSPVVRVGWNSASTTISNNFIAGGYIGIALRTDAYDVTLTDNNINNNDWAGVVGLSQGVHIITGNTIEYNNRGLSLGEGPGGTQTANWQGSEISSNIIRENEYGIYYALGSQPGPMSIGPDNEIYDNGDGIYINGPAYDVHINGNSIYGNTVITSGLHIEGADTGVDAKENWWGDATGPYEANDNPDGLGDAVYIGVDSQYIYYRPYCLDDGCVALSSVSVDPSNLSTSFDNGGSITPILTGPDDADPATYLVDQLQVNEDVNISFPSGSGTSTVTLPAGTVITKTGGGTFDANDLTATETALSSLSGFPTGQVVEGAIEWGLPDLGLTFSQPITVTIFVGTDLNGRTLSLVRSNSMTGGWTNDGIVPPAQCVVSAGLCTFQTTKASYFAANSQASSGGSSGGGGGSYSAPGAVGDGALTVSISLGGTGNLGRLGAKGVNVLHYINSLANFEAQESKSGLYGQHSFKVTDLDLLNKKYTFTIQSDPQTFTLGLNESVQVDLDGDGVKDVSLKFTNLYVNRIETTIKSLTAAAETPEVSTIGQTVVTLVADFLAANNIVRDSALESEVLAQVQADAKEFNLVLEGMSAIVDYVTYGNSVASLKFGRGERRAILRDYMETVNRNNIVWEDMERLAVGQIPKVRNLEKERANVSRALPVFRKIFGHDPNFQNETENLAWNTLMYRIRFTRDLGKEGSGLALYRKLYGRYPNTPFGWSVVRVLGYVK